MSGRWMGVLAPLLALALAPLLQGVIGKTKALVGGRSGAPLLQPYRDLRRLLGKGEVVGTTATWVFRAGPSVSLAAVVSALFLLPEGPFPPPLSFSGDFVLLAYLLALSRFALVAAAMDTGSSFEGMGASREAAFSALAEPAFFLVLGGLARARGGLSLAAAFGGEGATAWGPAPALFLMAGALFLVLLAENSRIPVDDPATHLELTMIHEVMVLDHSGPDLAFLLYGASLKLWLFSGLFVDILLPSPSSWRTGLLLFLAGMALTGVLVGMVESVMARMRLVRVPQYLGLAAALAGFSVLLLMAGGRP